MLELGFQWPTAHSLRALCGRIYLVITLALITSACQAPLSTPQMGATPDPVTSNNRSSWHDLLALAQMQAKEAIQDPTFKSVVSRDNFSEEVIRCPNQFEFMFVNGLGQSVEVLIEDGTPASVIDTKTSSGSTPRTDEYLTQLRDLVNHVELGPSQVCQLVLSEATGYKLGPELALYLGQELDAEQQGFATDNEPGWVVRYLLGPGSIKGLRVSARTGEIVERWFVDAIASPTPLSK